MFISNILLPLTRLTLIENTCKKRKKRKLNESLFTPKSQQLYGDDLILFCSKIILNGEKGEDEPVQPNNASMIKMLT